MAKKWLVSFLRLVTNEASDRNRPKRKNALLKPSAKKSLGGSMSGKTDCRHVRVCKACKGSVLVSVLVLVTALCLLIYLKITRVLVRVHSKSVSCR